MRQIILSTECNKQSGETIPVFGKWSSPEVILAADQDWLKDKLIGCFPDTAMRIGDVLRFYHNSSNSKDGAYNLEVAEFFPDGTLRRNPLLRDREGAFTLSGLAEHIMPIQPNVFEISPGNWRMYFWGHHHKWEDRTVRFFIAESTDGMHWKIKDGCDALLYHYTDVKCRNGAVPHRKQSNDATTVYRHPDGSWEIYSAALWRVPENSARTARKDFAAGCVRIIQRWTSKDGLEFGDPEIVLVPDENDPADLQFYYLAAHRMEHYRLGFIGRYSCADQKLEIEPAYSFDGVRWKRPFRKNCVPPLPDTFSHLASHFLLEEGDRLRMFFQCGNFDHNFKTMDGSSPENRICTATIHRRRMFGIQCDDASLMSPPVRLVNESIVFHTESGSDFDISFRDPFGQPLPDTVSVRTGGNERNEVVVPAELRGTPARLHIQGHGVFYDAVL